MDKEVLIVTTYHDLPGISDGEEISYYLPGERDRLRRDLVEAARHYSSLFASSYDYAESFSCADYGVDEGCFDEIELNVFRSVLSSEDREQPFAELHPRDIFNGCYAIVQARLQSDAITTVLSGVELFNDLMESGLLAKDRSNPRCYIQVVPAADFAGPFLHWIGGIAEVQHSVQNLSDKAERVRTGFQTLREAVKVLETSFQLDERPLSDFLIGKFLFIMDCYLRVTDGNTEPIFHSSRLSPYHLSMAEMSFKGRSGPELCESDVIRDFAEPICKRMTRRCISRLQQMTSGGLPGDDSALENLWDEICAQVQCEESFYWDAYDQTARDVIRAEFKSLQRHEREAVWLQTPEGFDWLFDDEQTREKYPVCEDEVIEYLAREHIYSRAADWSNKRIRAYLDHDYEID